MSTDDLDFPRRRRRKGIPASVWVGLAMAGGLVVAGGLALAVLAKKRGEPARAEQLADGRVISPGGVQRAGAVAVRVESVVPATQAGAVMILVSLTVDNDRLQAHFDSWRSAFLKPRGVRCADNFGNEYRPVKVDLLNELVLHQVAQAGNLGSGAVNAETPRSEYLFLERPLATAEYLDLDLDARAVGGSGLLLFRVPRAMWAGPAL